MTFGRILDELMNAVSADARNRKSSACKDGFVMRWSRLYLWIFLAATLLLSGITVLLILSGRIDLAVLFGGLDLLCGLLALYLFSWKCMITDQKIARSSLFIFHKTVYWKDVRYAKQKRDERDQTVYITLYGNHKALIDFSSQLVGFDQCRKQIRRKGIPFSENHAKNRRHSR